MPGNVQTIFVTFLLASAGAALALLCHIPLPFLFGPMTACLVAALCGLRLRAMPGVPVLARTILGVAVGASITPQVLAQIPQMTISLAVMPVYVAVIGAIGIPLFRRLGFDRVTAYYAAMPGGLQDMVLFGQEAGGDVRALSLIHATRVAVIVTIVPFVATSLYDVTLSGSIGAPMAELPPVELLLMAAAALLGWKGGVWLGLFGASLLGPMILAAALSLGGVIHSRPPAEAIVAAQFFIGIGIGAQYVGVTLSELRRIVSAGLVFVIVLAVLAAIFTELATLAGLGRPIDMFLSFAPGGQAEMALLAMAAGADAGFVVLHHLTRMVIVILGAPVMARLTKAMPR